MAALAGVKTKTMAQMSPWFGGGPGLPDAPDYAPLGGAGYDTLKGRALNPGQSAWLGLAKQQNQALSENQQEQAVNSNAGQTASAMDNLAMQGGLSSGARERIAEGGVKSASDARQGINRQASINDLQAGMTDAEDKNKMLSMLPGLENQKTQSLNDANMAKYHEQMQAWAAGRQADATENSGKK